MEMGKEEGEELVTVPVAQAPTHMAPIYVTKTFLPPQEEYLHWLNKAWESHVLTNNGPIHRELEETLRRRFEVPHLKLMANGTLALQLAIRALGIKGKVITTPYSYVATTSAILWEGCEPVFVDIKQDTLCIDPDKIEGAIDADTTAILATHVYGIPCDVETIEAIANRHGLKVIYDAAHAFDVKYKGKSILQWGDASTLSFHATKLFHTLEGGAVVLHDAHTDHQVRLLRSFGHIGDEHYTLGINAKTSEFHAAMGMSVLPYVEELIKRRKKVISWYDRRIAHLFERPQMPAGTDYNQAYYPVLFKNGGVREEMMKALMDELIHPRRYFYPSLDQLPYLRSKSMPVSVSAADRVLCLPLYADLSEADVDRICSVLINAVK
jgi:dTDP-4-amino-4,6-dideoxygalactose transaminase